MSRSTAGDKPMARYGATAPSIWASRNASSGVSDIGTSRPERNAPALYMESTAVWPGQQENGGCRLPGQFSDPKSRWGAEVAGGGTTSSGLGGGGFGGAAGAALGAGAFVAMRRGDGWGAVGA